MRVVFLDAAKADLNEIGEYIAEDNARRAVSFVRELRNRALGLKDMALAFPLVPEFATLGVRRRVFGGYIILYRIGDDQISILRVLHGARDWEVLIQPED